MTPSHMNPTDLRQLLQAIQDPEFDKPDSIFKRSGHDYAYDGLWLLVVGGEIEYE